MVDRITPMTSPAHRRQLAQRQRRGRRLAGGLRTLRAMGAGRSFQRWAPGLGKGRRAVHRRRHALRGDEDRPAQRQPPGAHLPGLPARLPLRPRDLGDPLLRRYVRAFMDRDVAPLLAPVPGIDLERYRRQPGRALRQPRHRRPTGTGLLGRLVEVSQVHRPHRQSADRRRPAAGTGGPGGGGLGAVPGRGRRAWRTLPDSRSARRRMPGAGCRTPRSGRRLLGVETVFGPAIPASAAFVEAFERLYDSLRRHGVSETLRQVLGE